MVKQGNAMMTFITGLAMGAAAVFLSKKENRDIAKKKLEDTKKAAQKLKTDLEKNPEKVKKDAITKGKQIASSVTNKAKKVTDEKATEE
ncbi:MAG: hypothetical protein WDZ94_03600 [Patescibacteria group bacterium]